VNLVSKNHSYILKAIERMVK